MKCKKKNKKKFKMPIFLLGVIMIKTMMSIINRLKKQINKKLVLFTKSLHLLIVYNQ